MHSTYRVTVEDPNDPADTRTLILSEDEIRDSYPHWGGKPVITSREGFTVTIEPVADNEHADCDDIACGVCYERTGEGLY